jgi:hypothetical protein
MIQMPVARGVARCATHAAFPSPRPLLRLPHLHSKPRSLLPELLQLLVKLRDEGEQRIRVLPEPFSVRRPLQLSPEEPPRLVPLGDEALAPRPFRSELPLSRPSSPLNSRCLRPPALGLLLGRFGDRASLGCL